MGFPRSFAITLFVLAGAASLSAREWNVCVEDRIGLDRATYSAFAREFVALLGRSEIVLSCDSSATPLALRFYGPERYPTALGLAYRSSNQVLPRLEVYLNPVLRLINVRAPEIVGRALARVAAHEVGHYVYQKVEHDCEGLMRQSFTGKMLAELR